MFFSEKDEVISVTDLLVLCFKNRGLLKKKKKTGVICHSKNPIETNDDNKQKHCFSFVKDYGIKRALFQ